jgi:hypothetical protein
MLLLYMKLANIVVIRQYLSRLSNLNLQYIISVILMTSMDGQPTKQ